LTAAQLQPHAGPHRLADIYRVCYRVEAIGLARRWLQCRGR
jgi:hypothetical protein